MHTQPNEEMVHSIWCVAHLSPTDAAYVHSMLLYFQSAFEPMAVIQEVKAWLEMQADFIALP